MGTVEEGRNSGGSSPTCGWPDLDDLRAGNCATSVDQLYLAGDVTLADPLDGSGSSAHAASATNPVPAGLYYLHEHRSGSKTISQAACDMRERSEDYNGSIRLTWQASPRNKVSAQHQALQIRDHFYTQSATNRTQSLQAVIMLMTVSADNLRRAMDGRIALRGGQALRRGLPVQAADTRWHHRGRRAVARNLTAPGS